MKLTYSEIQKNIAEIANKDSYNSDLIFELLAAYGRSASTITQLKQGTLNKSDDENVVLQNEVVYFKVYPLGTVLQEKIEEIEEDPLTQCYRPRYLIATDLNHLVAKDTRKNITPLSIDIKDIDNEIAFFYGWTGNEIDDSGVKGESDADRRAADKMKQLYAEIEKENLVSFAKEGSTFRHDLNVFFSRLLFCLFAEDTELFKPKEFSNAIKNYTLVDGSDLDNFFVYLFKSLDSKEKAGLSTPFSDFPYVNGTIFDTSRHGIVVPKFNAEARHLIIDISKSNWSDINPDIFGTIFQGIVDPDRRDESGMDYTSVPNILKVIEPLFMDELHDQFDKYYDNEKKLFELWNRISKIKIFDPACGSGNFLIISYKKLRQLENAIIARINELKPGGIGVKINSSVKLSNFYGIELDDFAHELAILSLYIAAHQMNIEFEKQFGKKLSIIPLIDIPTIQKGNAARIDWQDVCPNKPHKIEKIEQGFLIDFGEPEQIELPVDELIYDEIYLIGNPPYKGSRKQSKNQKEDIKHVFSLKTSRYKDLDYISIWFYKGAKYIEGTDSRLSFVSTNSISQGDQVGMLWPMVLGEKIQIVFAYSSFKWKNFAKDNAGVTVVIIGLSNKDKSQKKIYDGSFVKSVDNITPYLISAKNSTIIFNTRKNINTNIPDMPKGNMPYDGGNLLLSQSDRDELLSNSPEAEKYIKNFVNAKNFLNGQKQYCLWIIDSDYDDAMAINYINSRVEKVRRMRLDSSDKAANKLASRPHQFREINEPSSKSLVVPSTSSENRLYIPMAYLDDKSISSNANFVIYDAPLWLFALLESKMHMAWIRTVCGKLKTDYRYSSTLGYNTFPVPIISEDQKDKLTKSAKNILMIRENHSEKTLADMYDPDKMPDDLREAHNENDTLVDRLYKNTGFRNDEERLAALFDLYEQMTKKK